MILMIDNYDSSTYNLVQILGQIEKEVLVKRNDQITLDEVEKLNPNYLVISSGSGRPDNAGITMEIIRTFSGKIPILGVGLGSHAIAACFGGKIIKTDRLLPGKPVDIFHDGKTIYAGLEQPFSGTRYHSLSIGREELPASLEVSAWGSEDEIMGIRHKEHPLEGVQFNPESIMTKSGQQLLKNFIEHYRMAVN